MTNYKDGKYFDSNCIFCKIIKGDIPAKIVKENEYVIAFNDLSPKAQTHILVVPKPHVKDIMHVDSFIMGKVLETIQEIVKERELEKSGFRVINNCGAGAGQSVFHVHFHILSGKLSAF